MGEVGLNLDSDEDVAGRLYLSRASRTRERRERLLAALKDEHYKMDEFRPRLLRFFVDLHIGADGGLFNSLCTCLQTVCRRSSWSTANRACPAARWSQ